MLAAPRILKAPIGCRFSHLREMGSARGETTSTTGVRTAIAADPLGGGFDLVERDKRRGHRVAVARGRANCSFS